MRDLDRHDLQVDRLIEAGLGQDYDSMTLARTREAWLAVGRDLQERLAVVLDGTDAHIELIGSSSVVGLLAKPIIDVAVGLPGRPPMSAVTSRLQADGWIYRGDAGTEGGHVFVLEVRPRHRVAHLHVVDLDGDSWHNYLAFRDLLRRSPEARRRYEEVKVALVRQGTIDRNEYTRGKTEVVTSLLSTLRDPPTSPE